MDKKELKKLISPLKSLSVKDLTFVINELTEFVHSKSEDQVDKIIKDLKDKQITLTEAWDLYCHLNLPIDIDCVNVPPTLNYLGVRHYERHETIYWSDLWDSIRYYLVFKNDKAAFITYLRHTFKQELEGYSDEEIMELLEDTIIQIMETKTSGFEYDW